MLRVVFGEPVGAIDCGTRLFKCPEGPTQHEPLVAFVEADPTAGYTVMMIECVHHKSFLVQLIVQPHSRLLATGFTMRSNDVSSGSNSARHWLLGNVPGHVLRSGFSNENTTAGVNIMQPYHGPHPPAPGTPGRTDYVHIYGQFAWKQPTPTIKFSPMDPDRHSCKSESAFLLYHIDFC